jgi:hypothetical protein
VDRHGVGRRPLPGTHDRGGRPARPPGGGPYRRRPGDGTASGARPWRPAPGHQAGQRPGGAERTPRGPHGLRHRGDPGREGPDDGRHAGRLTRLHGPRAHLRSPPGPAVRHLVPRRDTLRGDGRPLPVLPRHHTRHAPRGPLRGARTPHRGGPVARRPRRPPGKGPRCPPRPGGPGNRPPTGGLPPAHPDSGGNENTTTPRDGPPPTAPPGPKSSGSDQTGRPTRTRPIPPGPGTDGPARRP